MADMTPLTDILNGDPADATDVQNNFQTIEAYINGTDLVRTDGTEVMAADLDMDGNKVVNLADGTADGDAVNYGQLTQSDSPLPLGKVASATATSSQGPLTGSTTYDITGLSVTWTAVSARLYRITIFLPQISPATAHLNQLFLTDASNTQIQTAHVNGYDAYDFSMTLISLETGLSGSITRKARIKSTGTSFTLDSSSTSPSLILVEDLGLA